MKMYKDGAEATVMKVQQKLFEKAGWSRNATVGKSTEKLVDDVEEKLLIKTKSRRKPIVKS